MASQDSYQVLAPSSAVSNESTPQDNGILPLIERVPDVEMVVEFLKSHHRIKGLLSNPSLFESEVDLEDFTNAYYFACSKGDDIPDPDSDEWFWEDACDYMFESLCENIPSSRKDLKKCRARYFADGVHLVQSHFRQRILTQDSFVTPERKRRLRNISGLIGEVFLEVYEQLTAPPRGKKILLISQQLQKLVQDITTTNLDKLFVDGIDKHVYYISGFLCRVGEKEAERRSQDAHSDGFLLPRVIKRKAKGKNPKQRVN